MKETEKLIGILTKFGPRKLPLLNQSEAGNSSLETQLYENIKAGKYKNEEEALLDLYKNEEDYYKYRMLKSRLKQKLYNHLLFVENNTIIAKKEEKECLDMIHKGKLLLLFGEHSLAEKIFKKVVQISQPYEFTEIHMNALQNLSINYSELFDHTRFNETLIQLKTITAKRIKEDEAYLIYASSKMSLRSSVVERTKFIPKLQGILSKLYALWKSTHSFNIFTYYYFLNKWYLELIGDFEKYLKYIEEIQYLIGKNEINILRFDMRAHYFSHIYGLTRVKQFEKGLSLAPKYLEFFPDQARNWFAFLGHYMLLTLHAKKYVLSEEIIEKVFNNPNYAKLPKNFKESWFLYKAFLTLVFPQTKIKDFKHHEYFNSFSYYSKDKLGSNISILILQFLYLLKKKDYEQLNSKEETFRKYANTYLKDFHSKRSYYLFKLMLLIIRVDFCPGKSIKKGQGILEKLKNTPESGDAYSNVEIVPYENLWKVMINYLQINNGRSSDPL